jgi:hypothetical protein
VASTLTDHAAEGLDLAVRAGHYRVKAEEMCEQGLIARAPAFWVRQKQACGPERGQGRGRAFRTLRDPVGPPGANTRKFAVSQNYFLIKELQRPWITLTRDCSVERDGGTTVRVCDPILYNPLFFQI